MSRRRGWCPSLHAPMSAGDGLLLRVNAPSGRFEADELGILSRLAARYGNGMIELTSRARLQFRGFDDAGAAAFAAGVVEAGLASPDPVAERLRGAVVSPLAGLDPDCAPLATDLATELAAGIDAVAGTLAALPPKFGVVIDGGGAMALRGVAATVALRHRCGAWGVELGLLRAEAEAGRLVDAALSVMRALADARSDPMRSAGLSAVPVARTDAAAPVPAPVGPLPFGAFGLGAPTGALDADTLLAVATAARHGGSRQVRLTPWRSFVVPGWMPATGQATGALVTDPADPRLRVACCIGAPRCTAGSTPTVADAATLAAILPPATTLHVSGCGKGCARREPATLTLVGREGRYDAVWNGTARDAAPDTRLPAARGLDLRAAAMLLEEAA